MSNGKSQSPVIVFRERLISRREELKHALEGSGVSSDRFIRAATTAMQTMPELGEVSFNSMWIALLKACRDQLLPDGVQGAIVKYGKTATWIPMVRGLLNRFERSGHYKWIHADFHREGDSWRVYIDEHGQHFLHERNSHDEDRKIIETYACATTLSGAFFISIVTEGEMKRIRAMSRARADDAPWQKWPEEMMKKTALRRLTKTLPMPAPIEELMHRDQSDDDDDNGNGDAPSPPSPRPRTAQHVLEDFASDEPAPVHPEPSESPDGAVVAPDDAVSAASPVAAGGSRTVYLETAYERGKDARRVGDPREAVPPEYLERGRNLEAVAWTRGYNGEPLK